MSDYYKNWQEALEKAAEQIKELKQQIKELNQQIQTLSSENSELKNELRKKSEKIETMSRSDLTLKENKALESRLNSKQSKLDEKEAKLKNSQAIMNSRESKVTAREQAVSDREKACNINLNKVKKQIDRYAQQATKQAIKKLEEDNTVTLALYYVFIAVFSVALIYLAPTCRKGLLLVIESVIEAYMTGQDTTMIVALVLFFIFGIIQIVFWYSVSQSEHRNALAIGFWSIVVVSVILSELYCTSSPADSIIAIGFLTSLYAIIVSALWITDYLSTFYSTTVDSSKDSLNKHLQKQIEGIEIILRL